MSRALYFLATPTPGYPADHAETCHTLDSHRAAMVENGEEERILYRAVPDPSTAYFWCHAFHAPCSKDLSTCGQECPLYAPRNGSNGRCRHHGHCYTADPQRTKVLRLAANSEAATLARLRREGFRELLQVPGRGLCGVQPMLFTVALCYGIEPDGCYAGRYCYPTEQAILALAALHAWDGKCDPTGPWIKHKAPGVDACNPLHQ